MENIIDDLVVNDQEFIRSGQINNINEININNDEENENNIYKKEDFTTNKIINFLENNNIIYKNLECNICMKKMLRKEYKSYIDGLIWRCRGRNPILDNRMSIARDSIFENIRVPLQVLYFLTFYCFIENYSIEKSFIEVKSFCL